MKRALVKDSVKQIKNTLKRFISILMMAFLGVGFFAGIKATSPDMIDTIDRYYKEQNIYLRGLVPLVGYPSIEVQYSREERIAGESKYPKTRYHQSIQESPN